MTFPNKVQNKTLHIWSTYGSLFQIEVDSVKLNLRFAPQINLTVASKMPLRENGSALLACNINAKPLDNVKISWYKGNQKMRETGDVRFVSIVYIDWCFLSRLWHSKLWKWKITTGISIVKPPTKSEQLVEVWKWMLPVSPFLLSLVLIFGSPNCLLCNLSPASQRPTAFQISWQYSSNFKFFFMNSFWSCWKMQKF